MDKSEICVLIPAYNEEKNISRLALEIKNRGFGVLVVDDGSSDGTSGQLQKIGVDFIRSNVNEGKGAALRKGFERFLGRGGQKILVMMDADGQHDPREIDLFIAALQDGRTDFVIGNRMHDPKKMPRLRRATNCFLSWIISAIAGQAIPDSQCGYRAITRQALKRLWLQTAHFEIESEMLLEAARQGLAIRSIPIRSLYEGGKSQIRPLKDTFRFLKFIVKYIFHASKKE